MEEALKEGHRIQFIMSMGDIIYGLKGYHMSTSGQYHEMVRPEGYDETVKKLLLEKDSGKRKELILKAVKIFYDEVSFIPLNVEARLAILNKNLHDVDYTSYVHQNSNIFKNAWISKK